MGKVINFVILAVILGNIFTFQQVFAADNENTIQSFIKKSLEIQLQQRSSWRDLMHYRSNIFDSGYTSQADSKNFFNAINGKYNPKDELIATIRALFAPVKMKDPDEHPQCLFVARKNWLIDHLSGLKSVLPKIECSRFNKWISAIKPDSVTLVFPSAYINNPGSMFGHTLLRIDQAKSTQTSNLTSYAITYAANTVKTNGLSFAVKGLFGAYQGLFDIIPYYVKVNEYNDLENRDIWEYQLNLTPVESTRLLQHMWELRKINFDYYFLDENCSYQLLALLDVARPGLNLAAEFPMEVTPVDTVRVIQDKKLVINTPYRPSLLTNLKFQLENFSGENLDLILDLIHGVKFTNDIKFKSLSEKEQIYVLEIAYNYLQYLYKSGDIKRIDYSRRSLALLKARNKLNPEINLPLTPAPKIRPEQGHRTSRMIYSLGSRSDNGFVELNWRPAYHDLLDNTDGFVEGLQINFLDIAARINTNNEKIHLQKFDFLNLSSLRPRTRFFSPNSWKIKIGYQRLPILTENNKLVFNFNGARGVSYQPFDSILVYGLIEVTALVDYRLKNYTSLAIGPNLGLFWQVSPSWKMWLETTSQFYDKSNNLTYQRFELAQSLSINKKLALRLFWLKDGIKEKLQNEIKFSVNWYY